MVQPTMSRNSIIVVLIAVLLVGGSAGILLHNNKSDNAANGDTEYEEGYPRTVEDFLGNKVTFDESPKRIVTGSLDYLSLLGPEVTDRVIWSSSKPISTTDANPMFEVLEDLAKLHTSGNLNTKTEEVIAAKPDLVLMSDAKMTEKELGEFKDILNEVGINVFYCSSQTPLFDDAKGCIEFNLLPIAKIFNMEERAQELIDFMGTKTDEFLERLSHVDNSSLSNVFVGGGADKPRTEFLSSSEITYTPILYLEGYMHNIMTDLAPGQDRMTFDSVESLYQYEKEHGTIDYIFISQSAWSEFKTLWNNDKSKFEAFEAFSNGDVYYVMDWYPRATNPLICAYAIATIMFPDEFGDFDIKDLIVETYELFYGFEGAGDAAYNVLVDKTNGVFKQDVGIFGKVDLTKI